MLLTGIKLEFEELPEIVKLLVGVSISAMVKESGPLGVSSLVT
jgi:hypothetical protein